MADVSYSSKATERVASPGVVAGKGNANVLQRLFTSTIELAGSAANTTIKLGRIPSNTRISGLSKVYWDDLATAGSPTLDIGLGSVNSNITSDDDALNDGLDLATAASSASVIKDVANYGKQAWEFVNGQTSDPTGLLDVYATIKDASTTATGTITVELFGAFD